VQRDKDAADQARRDEERRAQKSEQAAEKERARLDKEEQRKSKESKPSKISGLFGRGRATSGAATTKPAGALGADGIAAEHSREGMSTSDPATMATLESTSTNEPATLSSNEDVTAGTGQRITSNTSSEGATFHDLVTSPVTEAHESPVITQVEPATASSASTPAIPITAEKKPMESMSSTENRSSVEDDNAMGSSPKQSRMKSWMKVRFRSKSNAQKEAGPMPVLAEADTNKDKSNAQKEAGAMPALIEADRDTGKDLIVDHDEEPPRTSSAPDVPPMAKEGKAVEEVPRTDSMRDVAMAGRTTTNETGDMYGGDREVSPERNIPKNANKSRSTSISSLSSSDEDGPKPTGHFDLGTTEPPPDESEERGRAGFAQRLMNMVGLGTAEKTTQESGPETTKNETITPDTTNRSNDTDDEFEESKDQFEEEKLQPPPPLSSLAGESNTKKTVSPLGSRDRSRFTEEL